MKGSNRIINRKFYTYIAENYPEYSINYISKVRVFFTHKTLNNQTIMYDPLNRVMTAGPKNTYIEEFNNKLNEITIKIENYFK